MEFLDLTFPTPAENLACDEALLDAAETGSGGEVLRFWESPEFFVVVGYGDKVQTEVNVAACEGRRIPILRRCSGGGTVVQGPGCLSYGLVLQITEDNPIRSISSANEFIMERNRSAADSALRAPHGQVRVQGYTDLAIGSLKFSGNSQRRRKHFLLFHGTFLLDFDVSLVSTLLHQPSREPDYRASRSHNEFMTNLHVSLAELKAALTRAWGASNHSRDFPQSHFEKLVAEKYSTKDWNFKF
jgi:lipoate-protein ligase A